jgi:hypothetical protein
MQPPRLRRLTRRTWLWPLLLATATAGSAQELRPGVWAANDASALPLPVSGYQVYLMGEMHGVKENAAIFGQYLSKLNRAGGLRDVAIEEKSVYERDAQAYVEGRSSSIPADLCLRANVIDTVRQLNQRRAVDQLICIHLVDIDSPAEAIHRHLQMIKEKVASGTTVSVPDAAALKTSGLKTVEELRRLPASGAFLGELRTIEHSIRALQLGFEVEIGQAKGSTYLDDREDAVAANIRDVLGTEDAHGVLGFYGDDHVAKVRRQDGGPDRNLAFAPMALRLQESGVKVFSVATFPLSGRFSWRGQQGEMMWTAQDGSMANGETMDKFLAKVQHPALLYIDPKQERVMLPSQDVTRSGPDAFLLITTGTAMENRCPAR